MLVEVADINNSRIIQWVNISEITSFDGSHVRVRDPAFAQYGKAYAVVEPKKFLAYLRNQYASCSLSV